MYSGMPFRFQKPAGLAEETERIAMEQIDRAIAEIDDKALDRDHVIHQVRKRCKKLRGLLRLVRCGIGGAYKLENAWFRDVARVLSSVRDAGVMVETYDALMDFFTEEVDRRALSPVRRKLTLRAKDRAEGTADAGARLAECRGRLEEARRRVPGWAARAGDLDSLLAAMAKTYRRGREALDTVRADPTDANFHEWRKRVKYHMYHCRLFHECWEPLMKTRASETKHLADLLGEDHDLAVLRGLLHDDPGICGTAERQEAVRALIDRQRGILQRDARLLGARVYAAKPGVLRDEFARYAAAWKEATED